MFAVSYFRRTFYSLENDRYRVFWLGTLASFLGMQMQVLARGYLAYDLTGKNSALGMVMLAFGVPQLLLGLWGGVLADRLPKRQVLIVAQTIIALNSAWIATMIELHQIQFWMLIVAGVVQGAGFAFVGPARQAFISDLVGKDSIGNAVVLQQMSMNSTRVVGPSIAGAMIAVPLIGVAGVYYVTTLGFIITVATMFKLPRGNPKVSSGSSPLADMAEGLRYVKSRPSILLLILTSFSVVMIGFPYQSFLPSIAKGVYHVNAGGLGALSSVSAVGAVIATVMVATYAEHRRAWAMQPILALAFGVAVVGLGLTSNILFGLMVIFFVGALASAFQSLNNSLTMSATDGQYHGRVQSISMLSWSLFGLMAYPIGRVADIIGIQETLMLQGALCVALVLGLQMMGRSSAVKADRKPRTAVVHEVAGSPAGGGGR